MGEFLKQCPFCGCTDVTMHTNGSDLDNYSYVVECDGCGCTLDTGWQTEEKAAEEWNLRKERTAKVENIEDPAGLGAYGDCSECGAEVNEQNAYCPNCGARLEWE